MSTYIRNIVKASKQNIWHQLQEPRAIHGEKWYYEQCERFASYSFLCFVQAVKREKFELKNFHLVIAAVLEHLAFSPPEISKRLILAAPPRSGKSTIVQLFTAWLTGMDPTTAHMFASYGQRLSTRFMAKIHAIVSEPAFCRCFPTFEGFASGSKTELCQGGFLTATSVGGAVTGFDAGSSKLLEQISKERSAWEKSGRQGRMPGTPGLLTVDDPLKSGASEAELAALDNWWGDEFNTRRTGNWLQLLIATRFSQNDLHGKLLRWDGIYDSETNPEGWIWLNIEAIATEDNDILGRRKGEALWEGHPTLNTRELLKLKEKNPQRFGAVYQGNPTVEDTGLVKSSDLKAFAQAPEDFSWKVMALDVATGSSNESDSTAIVIVGISTIGQLWIIDTVAKNLNFVDLRLEVKDQLKYHKPDVLGVELASSGIALYQELEQTPETYDLDAELLGLKPKTYGSKTKRLDSVMDLIKQCEWSDTSGNKLLRKELQAFPFGVSDDMVDALAWALISAREDFRCFEPDSDSPEDDYYSLWDSSNLADSPDGWGML